MTSLLAALAAEIRQDGPITVDAFMARCLGDPDEGYYMRRDPFGAEGDFITAPETSQMFGELLGLWCVDLWQRMGRPAPFLLAELGPGRGLLIADALRAARVMPDFLAAARLRLVETSPRLRAAQAEALAGAGIAPEWCDRVEDLPALPSLVLANEFFDALPIRQFRRTANGWAERRIGLDADAQLCFVDGATDPALASLLPAAMLAAPEGAIAEICEPARAIARHLAGRFAERAGAALIVDYGPMRSAPGDSLQAVRNHQPHPVLAKPGSADLTAHVDFETLARVAVEAGAAAHGPIAQGDLLARLGIEARARRLAAAMDEAGRAVLARALRRLTAGDQMGSLFKALAIASPDLGPPAAFEPPRC
ncbi:class I SAM-dependent methyltransferase [Oceanibacterium hippocampi]|uniref:SAM-dependent methyltransferase n=1 Tax=Oceanibacterium hippocampi TaxID=745714 RepID=A0A1Y5TVT7_9PROT|nr:SAM-dependent methyltransferase [Oceanibacterium hippocampi]SLN74516.1 hypothetical protein OCH7691_03767 [Oceanibacterium hippocampi]